MSYEVTMDKIKKVDKRILDAIRNYNSSLEFEEHETGNAYFLLCEWAYLSCKRKKDRGQQFRGSFANSMLIILSSYIDQECGLMDEIRRLMDVF